MKVGHCATAAEFRSDASGGVTRADFGDGPVSPPKNYALQLLLSDHAARLLHRHEYEHEDHYSDHDRPGAGQHELMPRLRVRLVQACTLDDMFHERVNIEEHHSRRNIE